MLELKRQKAKSYHNRSSIILPDLEIGQEVRVAGSYMVEVNGVIIR